MEDVGRQPRFASENATFVSQDGEFLLQSYGYKPQEADQPASSERFARLRRCAGPAGRLAWTMACASGVMYVMLHGAHYKTDEIADTGVSADVSIEPLDSQPGLNVNTVIDVGFNDVTALPVGVHVSPKFSTRTAKFLANTGGMSAVVDPKTNIINSAKEEIKPMATYFGIRAGIGLVAGAAGGAAVGELSTIAIRIMRDKEVSKKDVKKMAKRSAVEALLGVVAATGSIAGGGAAVAATTYNANWYHDWTASGDLVSTAMNIPKMADEYFARNKQNAEYTKAIFAGINALSQPMPESKLPQKAFDVLVASDFHNNDTLPYLKAEMNKPEYNVNLVLVDGDWVEGGFAQELRPKFLRDLKDIANKAPVVAVLGNHDPHDVGDVLARIPNVHVLYKDTLNAYGLQILGVSDPTGTMPEGGPEDPAARKVIEQQDADTVAAEAAPGTYFDIAMTHDPDESDRLQALFGNRIRISTAGHVHVENRPEDIQKNGKNGPIRLIEGTTGAGGLARGHYKDMPGNGIVSFSILSFASNCQALDVTRFNIHDWTMRYATGGPSADTIIHKPLDEQPLNPERRCGVDQGIGPVESLESADLPTMSDYGVAEKDPQQAAPTPATVSHK